MKSCFQVRVTLSIILLLMLGWSPVSAQGLEQIDVYLELADSFLVIGNYQEANRYLELAALLDPQDNRLSNVRDRIQANQQRLLHYELATAFERQGHIDQANQNHLLALDSDPAAQTVLTLVYSQRSAAERASALCDLASLYEKRDMYGAAEEIYRQAVQVDPLDSCPDIPLREIGQRLAEAYAHIGHAFAQLSLNAEAREYLGQALARDPQQALAIQVLAELPAAPTESAWAHYRIGMIYLEHGLLSEARESFETALAIAPTFEPAITALESAIPPTTRVQPHLTCWSYVKSFFLEVLRLLGAILLVYALGRWWLGHRKAWRVRIEDFATVAGASDSQLGQGMSHRLIEHFFQHRIEMYQKSSVAVPGTPQLLAKVAPAPTNWLVELLLALLPVRGVSILGTLYQESNTKLRATVQIVDLRSGTTLDIKTLPEENGAENYERLVRDIGHWLLFTGHWIPPWERGTDSPASFKYAMQGLKFQLAGKLDKARSKYQRALKLDDGNGIAHLNLGFMCERQAKNEPDWQEAHRHFRQATRRLPNKFKAYWGLANAHKALNHYRSAISGYGRALHLMRKREEMVAWRNEERDQLAAWCTEIQLNRARAYQSWHKALKKQWWRVDRIIKRRKAKRSIARVERQKPQDARLLYTLATFHVADENYPRTAKYLGQAIKADETMLNWVLRGGWSNFRRREEWRRLIGELVNEGIQFDINAVNVEEVIALLQSPNQAQAQAIIDHRDKLGGFTNVEQLAEVVDQDTLEQLRELIKFGEDGGEHNESA
jgi:tetratricopeptide (TPR) repeat protein